MADQKLHQNVHKLEKEHELRIEASGKIVLTVTNGSAEIFGTELVEKREYTFSKCKIAVFTWNGCQLVVKGKCDHSYVSEETPMVSYINTHAAIEEMRNESKSKGDKGRGPVIMVAGPKDSGKSTLCRILLSYAVRLRWMPTFVDLDVGQNEITAPACLAACPIDQQIGIDESWKNRAPVVFYYGHTSPAQNKGIYQKLCGKVAEAVEKRCEQNESARHAGVIINTSGWIDGGGQELLVDIAKKFKANVICVLGQEKLVSELKSSEELQKARTVVVKLDKSGGVVSRTAKQRVAIRNAKIRQYFYGRVNELSPHEKTISSSEVLVYRVGSSTRAPTTALPVGAKSMLDPNRCVKVGITSALNNSILAVSYAKKPEELLECNIAGLVYVKEVDTKKQQMTILAPSAGNLPHRFLLHGSIKW
eukprot:CAMPEP_0114524690 /NCGR_PEP_ID=MMETSP0109-20121206/21999_1 /TAXON_ID=29199 /ORGANISM="Chlorarachnion reptans, Strain CCCM449" /LENGTH=419 /DNA_ID=CAMNT_0001706169 /DNA_START=206 /DNA_END=1462 /DNA_ORIENTATION=-